MHPHKVSLMCFPHCIAVTLFMSMVNDNNNNNNNNNLSSRYQDMRRQIGFEIRDMWYNLGKYRPHIAGFNQACSVLMLFSVFTDGIFPLLLITEKSTNS